ncbi:MAG TPA: GNAT family N-acetyltransferase [Phycisphaerales bacterium]|nr:GNAT family N-acetyltransferase [Phycisphaerales bacterium]
MLTLREVRDSDLDIFFLHQQDRDACYQAAFVGENPSDRTAFNEHWARIRSKPTITIRTIEVAGEVAGYVASFMRGDEREVTYWLGREHWGKGHATGALREFLKSEPRPIHARAAKDNTPSIRVLEKCGFRLLREERGYANARQCEIAEVVMVLRA